MPAGNPARSDMDSTGAPFVPFLRSIRSAAGRQSASWRPRVFVHLRISAIFPGSSVIWPVGNRPVGQEATKALADLGHYHPELGSRLMSDRVLTLNSLRRVPSLQFAEHFDRSVVSNPSSAVLWDYIKGRIERASMRDWIHFRNPDRRIERRDNGRFGSLREPGTLGTTAMSRQ